MEYAELVTNAYVNISIEILSIVFLGILMVATVFQKHKVPTTRYIFAMSGIVVALLVIQILQWDGYVKVLKGNDSLLAPWLVAVIYTADYALVYWSAFMFFKYLKKHIAYVSHQTGVQLVKESKRIDIFLVFWGILIQVLMFIFTFAGYVFDITDFGTIPNMNWYTPILVVGALCNIINLGMIIKYRKIIGRYDSLIMSLYCVVIILTYPISILNYSGFSYIVTPIMIYILYLGVNIRRDRQFLEQESKLSQREADIEKSSMQIMVSQIQPHFLYNTLSVIDYLCGKDVELARTAINSFSEYLRMNMESIKSTNLVPFEKELEHTKTYLWIEKMRFSDILTIEYDIQYTDFMILPLTMQPICENAVKHGIRGREDGGMVKISTRKDGDHAVITVEDDGIGFDVNTKPEDGRIHVGIENVKKRLELVNGGRLLITSVPGKGTIATIIVGGGKNESALG